MTYPSLKNLAVKHYKLWACNVITSLAQIFDSWICHLSKFCNISARYDEQVSWCRENQYHAKKYGDLLGIFNSHCIISDAGVGESALGEGYEESFKDETCKYYKEQVESHKSVLYEQVRINE